MTRVVPEVIQTDRLLLIPLDDETADHIVRGDLSCLDHVSEWPHEDTIDAVRLRAGGSAVWLVGLDGVVIGDCGTAGLIVGGTVEIGFGLAESHRGRGYGTELVGALSDWLLSRDGITRLAATTDAGNLASRCVLEKSGFVPARTEDGVTRYVREGP